MCSDFAVCWQVHTSVDVGKEMDKKALCVEECIDEFIKPEELSEADAFFCPKCAPMNN